MLAFQRYRAGHRGEINRMSRYENLPLPDEDYLDKILVVLGGVRHRGKVRSKVRMLVEQIGPDKIWI